MDFFENYKPFRNYMRRFSLVESLVDVWRYSLNVLDNIPLPPDYAVGKPPFEPINRNLRRWNDLAGAVNHIRRLDDEAYAAFGDQRDVLLEIHRIVHRQFPWQI